MYKKNTHLSKIIKTIIVLFLICVLLMGVLVSAYLMDKKLTFEKQEKYIPGIVCIGDSLTEGTDGSYPSYLEYILRENNIRVPVYNLGVGGENTVTIAGRMGAIPFILDAFEIPAGVERTAVTFVQSPGKSIEPLLRSSDGGINPCQVCGVEGELSYDSNENVYYFTRSEAGDAISVPENSEVVTYASYSYTNNIYILFMGENVSYENAEELLEQQKAIIATQTGDDRYLIIGITSGTKEEREHLETLMYEYWGDRYINLREILSDKDILESHGIVLTEKDLEDMEQGIVPQAVRSDHVHYTAAGYAIVAEVVYEKMLELGYLTEVMEEANSYASRWGWIQKIKDLL